MPAGVSAGGVWVRSTSTRRWRRCPRASRRGGWSPVPGQARGLLPVELRRPVGGERSHRAADAIDHRDPIAEVVGHGHPARVEERQALGHLLHGEGLGHRGRGQAGEVELHDHQGVPPRAVGVGAGRVEGSKRHRRSRRRRRRRRLRAVPHGREVVDQHVGVEDAADQEPRAVGREGERRDVVVGGVLHVVDRRRERDRARVVAGHGLRRGVHGERLHHAVVGGDQREVGRHEDDAGVQRVGHVELHRSGDRARAAGHLREIDEVHRVRAVALVDGQREAPAGDGDLGGETRHERGLVEEPLGAGGAHAAPVGEEVSGGVAGVGPGVEHGVAARGGHAALRGDGRGIGAVPRGAGGGVVRDRLPWPVGGAHVFSRHLRARGHERAGVPAGHRGHGEGVGIARVRRGCTSLAARPTRDEPQRKERRDATRAHAHLQPAPRALSREEAGVATAMKLVLVL